MTSLESVIHSPLMPYKNFASVRDLVASIEHYYGLLSKLTIIGEGEKEARSLKKKISL